MYIPTLIIGAYYVCSISLEPTFIYINKPTYICTYVYICMYYKLINDLVRISNGQNLLKTKLKTKKTEFQQIRSMISKKIKILLASFNI